MHHRHGRIAFQTFSPSSSAIYATSENEDTSGLMKKARECADSETCSIADANHYLHDILLFQGNCAAGLQGSEDLYCNDADNISEIVVGLRSKVNQAKPPA